MSGQERCNRYVEQVLDGDIVVPETVRQACERFMTDLERDDLDYDVAAAEAAIFNIEQLRHVKGRWFGKNIVLEDWQCFVVANIFGWKWKATGKRRFRYAYLRIPRKNGKTLLAICIALQLFAADNEAGAEVYLGATGQEQARDLLFNPAKKIVEMCPEFAQHYGVDINASTLVIPDTFSRLKSVIKKPDDGLNPSACVVDEYHHHDTDDQFATFDTGMGSRDQPLLLVVTTAGSNLGGPCKEYDDDSMRVLQGDVDQDSRFIMIWQPDKNDEWDSMETLKKVNPNLGVSVSEEYLADQLNQARRSATKQNQYRTKHLNQWVGSTVAWMNVIAWQRQAKPKIRMEDLKGSPCWAGLDLSSKLDTTALGMIFLHDNKWYGFAEYFAPEQAAKKNEEYTRYSEQPNFTLTEGAATDYSVVETRIRKLYREYRFKAIGFDNWQAQYLAQRLMERGKLPMTEFPMQVRTMSDPMKELEATVIDRRFFHPGCAVTLWQMGNVQCRMDAKDNVFPTKADNDPKRRIDGVVAMIMAMGLATRDTEEAKISDFIRRPIKL